VSSEETPPGVSVPAASAAAEDSPPIDSEAAPESTSQASPGGLNKAFLGSVLARSRSNGIVLAFLILFAVLSFSSSAFATSGNLLGILDQQASTIIIAAAATLVLVAGNFDLSMGSVYTLAGVVGAQLAQSIPSGVAILAGIGVGLAAGAVNGIIVTYFRINSLIATLAMSFVLAGLASLVTGGNLIILVGHPGFGDLAGTTFLGVKTSIWIALAVVVLMGALLARTILGHYMYAAGGNADAARLAGVSVRTVQLLTFVLLGGAAALGGIVDDSRVLSAQASSSFGESLTFTVIAGVIIGGTSILGGEGAVWRAIVGVLFIALIGNGYALLGLDPLYQQITLGGLMLAAVALDALARRRGG
jgi:ribose transport system permease protein